MPSRFPPIAIASVNLSPRFRPALDRWKIDVIACDTIADAGRLLQRNTCHLAVVEQVEPRSLESIASQITPMAGDRSTVVLARNGGVFVPGLFVVAADLAPVALVRLLHRISGMNDLGLGCRCADRNGSTCGVAGSPFACIF